MAEQKGKARKLGTTRYRTSGGSRERVVKVAAGSATSSSATPEQQHWTPTRRVTLSQAQQRTTFLIETLGSATAVAELLGVSRSQPGRWQSGAETPSPAVSTRLLDLDYVLARATLLWPREVAQQWLVGSEPLLNGARPIDVLLLRGSREVIDALDAVTAGAYA